MMKKRKVLVFALALIVVFGAGLGIGGYAATNQPGSAADPVITKSYLDSKISEFNKASTFKDVTLVSGSTLSLAKGATFVVVSGSGKSTAGLSDITLGKALAKGKAVNKNHNYLVKSASTGIKATSDSVVYVCGEYTIK